MQVGTIQGYDVIYVKERDQVFCKNTSVSFSLIKKLVFSNSIRENIPEKNLVITKDNNNVTLGCLVTTISNLKEISKNIKKIKNDWKK